MASHTVPTLTQRDALVLRSMCPRSNDLIHLSPLAHLPILTSVPCRMAACPDRTDAVEVPEAGFHPPVAADFGAPVVSLSGDRTIRQLAMGCDYIFADMKPEIVIRRARPNENNSVHALVQAIADETFADLFAPSQVPISEPNWISAWVAVSAEEIVGVTMTRDEWVSDLWVRSDSRRLGIGAKLLAQAELEIRSRGHEKSRLRVVKSNIQAVHFYESQGWRVRREFPHEKFGHAMFEMTKSG